MALEDFTAEFEQDELEGVLGVDAVEAASEVGSPTKGEPSLYSFDSYVLLLFGVR